MTPEEKLAVACKVFHQAQTNSKVPAKKYRKEIEKLLLAFWKETNGKGNKHIAVNANYLYTLLHQAVQTLP